MAVRRLTFAILAFSLLAGAGKPSNPRSGATAQATARIREPLILRAGAARTGEQRNSQQTRERRCATTDAAAGAECRIIVTDIE